MFESHMHVNTRGTFWSTQAAAKQMVEQGKGGSIIGVASISALLGGEQQVHYTPTKASVLSMMQSQACALGKHNIRCNALLPGTTRTPMAADDLAKPEKMAYLEQRIPLGRVAEPEDLAGPAVFLASDMSRYCVSPKCAGFSPRLTRTCNRLDCNCYVMVDYMYIYSNSCLQLKPGSNILDSDSILMLFALVPIFCHEAATRSTQFCQTS